MKIETGKANPDHTSTTKDIAVQVIAICIEAALDHINGIDAATTEAAYNNFAHPTEDMATDLTMTHYTSHITDHPHIAALWVINPEIAIDHTHDHPSDLQGMNHAVQIHTPSG